MDAELTKTGSLARSQYFGHAYFHARSPQYAVPR